MSIDPFPITIDIHEATDWVREHDDEDELVADPEGYAATAAIESGIPAEQFIQLGHLIAAQREQEGPP